MTELVMVALLAAALVGLSTLAGRRWGHEVAGLVGAFPLIVGPVLMLTAERQDAGAAARTALGTLLGLVALSGFALAYARSATRWSWPVSMTLGWAAAAVLGILAGRIEVELAGALAAAVLSITLARAALPRERPAAAVAALPRWELPARIALTAALIIGLTLAGERFGPAVAGILAALPTLASVLAVFTHARFGGDALVAMLRGMLGGLAGFVTFCTLIALLIVPAGVVPAFALATAAAVLVTAARLPACRRLALRETAETWSRHGFRGVPQARAGREGGPGAA
jgi:hypothetical protein